MKKSLIIVLLTALVLCAFTACDGDVNADLSGNVENKKTITLTMIYDTYKFENDTFSMVLEFPSSCETWKDLAEKGCSFVIKQGANSWTLTLGEEGGNACFKSSPLYKYSFIYEDAKSMPPKYAYTDPIENAGSYLLYIQNTGV